MYAYQTAVKGRKLNTATMEQHLYAITTTPGGNGPAAMDHQGPLVIRRCYNCGSTQHQRKACPKATGRHNGNTGGRDGGRRNDRARKLLSHLAKCLREDAAPHKGEATTTYAPASENC